ncbi:MAG: hypothetical protein V1717_03200, partial [Candidatus Micrarchaeota archaeon]
APKGHEERLKNTAEGALHVEVMQELEKFNALKKKLEEARIAFNLPVEFKPQRPGFLEAVGRITAKLRFRKPAGGAPGFNIIEFKRPKS